VGKFAASIKRQKVKNVLASGYPSDQRLYPWTLLGDVYRGLTVAFGGPPTL